MLRPTCMSRYPWRLLLKGWKRSRFHTTSTPSDRLQSLARARVYYSGKIFGACFQQPNVLRSIFPSKASPASRCHDDRDWDLMQLESESVWSFERQNLAEINHFELRRLLLKAIATCVVPNMCLCAPFYCQGRSNTFTGFDHQLVGGGTIFILNRFACRTEGKFGHLHGVVMKATFLMQTQNRESNLDRPT